MYDANKYKNMLLTTCIWILITTFSKLLAERYPKLAPLVLDEENITLALNEEYIPTGAVLKLDSGDVVALIPPISGG
jgi:molybdopterin converting factor small subunit